MLRRLICRYKGHNKSILTDKIIRGGLGSVQWRRDVAFDCTRCGKKWLIARHAKELHSRLLTSMLGKSWPIPSGVNYSNQPYSYLRIGGA